MALESSATSIGASSATGPATLSPTERERLRHPLERRVTFLVAVIDVILLVTIGALLMWGADWLGDHTFLANYKSHGWILLIALLGAPVVAIYAQRRRRLLAQEEGIRVSDVQLPEIYGVLTRQCKRISEPPPDLYLSDGVPHTTSFAWHHRNCIILSTHDFEMCPGAFDDIVDFAIARELGSICLGHTSFRSELLKSTVARFPFLKAPLHTIWTYSCDRYGATLAPRAIRGLIVAATGDLLRDRVDLNAYIAQIDEGAEKGFWPFVVGLLRTRVPLAHRVQELRRAGLLTKW